MTDFDTPAAIGDETYPNAMSIGIRFTVTTLSAPVYGSPTDALRCDLFVETSAGTVPDAVSILAIDMDPLAGRIRALPGSPFNVYVEPEDAPIPEGVCQQVYGHSSVIGGRAGEVGRAIRSAILARIAAVGDLCAELGPELLAPCAP